MKIQKIECPSCGSSLSANESESRVVCEYCGMTVIVEDTKQEGYNLELGAMKARASVSDELAGKIDKLKVPLCDYSRVSAEVKQLRQQKANLDKQVNTCEKNGKIIALAIASVFSFFLFLILCAAKANVGVFIFFGLIAAASFIVVPMIVLQYWDNVVKGSESTEKAIEAHVNTLKNFNQIINAYKDIVIPEKYRTYRAMEFISDAIRSQKANTINHAISQFEDVLRQEKTIALQEEQIRLQKQQLEQMQNGGTNITISAPKAKTTIIRQQGHSILVHLALLFFCGIGIFTIPYITLSKNHYWHL